MEKIPTAKEFVLKDGDGYLAGDYTPREVYALMIDFAKLHVEAALKEASEKAKIAYEYDGNTGSEYCVEYVDRDSILNSYPPENIK